MHCKPSASASKREDQDAIGDRQGCEERFLYFFLCFFYVFFYVFAVYRVECSACFTAQVVRGAFCFVCGCRATWCRTMQRICCGGSSGSCTGTPAGVSICTFVPPAGVSICNFVPVALCSAFVVVAVAATAPALRQVSVFVLLTSKQVLLYQYSM